MTTAVLLLVVAVGAVVVALVQTVRLRRARARAGDAEARAGAAADARDAFFDLATHELRSPLAAILGYQELLQDGAYGDLDPASQEPVTRIGRSARHLLHLIDGVVELSRLRAQTVRPEVQRISAGPLLAGIADAFRNQALDRRLEPVIEIQPDLPALRSDPERLLRALDLLVASAVKHPAGRTLHLEVRSSGDDLQLRIHPTDLALRDVGGDPELRVGLRLAIAARVAELLGGALTYDVDPEDGVIRALHFRVPDLAPEREGDAGLK